MERQSRIEGTIQKVSYNIYGWCGNRAIVIPAENGDMDVFVPKDKFIGDNGNLYHTVSLQGGDTLQIMTNEDYTIGRFPTARRTDPKQNCIFEAKRQGGSKFWTITKNDLPPGSVKDSPPNGFWDQFGRYYWDWATD